MLKIIRKYLNNRIKSQGYCLQNMNFIPHWKQTWMATKLFKDCPGRYLTTGFHSRKALRARRSPFSSCFVLNFVLYCWWGEGKGGGVQHLFFFSPTIEHCTFFLHQLFQGAERLKRTERWAENQATFIICLSDYTSMVLLTSITTIASIQKIKKK